MQCSACGESIPPTSRFCPACGQRVTAHGEERRVVSVVFADVVGFTSLSERRDPEQVKHLVDRCFKMLVADIVSFGGRVDKFIGDAILALFGAPLAHEDDAERAVRAALRMQQSVLDHSAQLDDVVRLRIGVNTGEVLVGALSAGGDYTAMGDVVNTASRLQTAANAGEVLVGATTYFATERSIIYDARGIVPAKGREEPVEAWVARSPRTAPGERPNRTGGPIVGRQDEVRTLQTVARTALASNRASLMVLLGDAGIGKSRVAAELIDQLGEVVTGPVLQGRCVPYGEVNVWWPLADALSSLLDVKIGASAEVVIPRLEKLVTDTLHRASSDRDTARVIAGLTRIFGFANAQSDLEDDRTKEEVTRSFVTLVNAMTDRAPVTFWLSDLHWADTLVLELLETVLTTLARRRFVVIATARRSLLSRWTPPTGRFDTFALNLEALDAEAADRLIDALLVEHGRTLGEADRIELRERSGGNPLFLVELLALLDEQPRQSESSAPTMTTLPDTLRGLIAARLDNLAPEERSLIDDAAVLGRRGKVDHLAVMAREIRGVDHIEAPLGALIERDLVRVTADTWEFASDLTREVAYGMLTKSDRAKKHLSVAQWIEAASAETMNDRTADLLAHHYGYAAELLHDVGSIGRLSSEVRERALHWIDEVSARNERLRLLPAAERLCTQGLVVADGDPEADAIKLRFLLRRGRARTFARDGVGALDDARAASMLAELIGDSAAMGRVALIEGEVAQQRGDLVTAQSTFARAAERFADIGDEDGRAEALRSLGLTEMFAGRTNDAERSTTAALDAFRALGRRSGEAWALQNLAWISFTRGRIDQAEERIDASLNLFEEIGDSGGGAWARGLQGFIRLAEGDLEEADRLQQSVFADARASGDRWASAMMLLLGAVVRLWTGRTEESVAAATESLSLFLTVHDRFGQARTAWPLARGLTMRGEADEARAVLAKVQRTVEELVGESESLEDRAILGVARAAIEVHLGNPERALSEISTLATELGFEGLAAALDDASQASDRVLAKWVALALEAGAGTDLVTSVVTALLQTGRVGAAATMIDAALSHFGEDSTSAALLTTATMVRAVDHDLMGARDLAARVRGDERSSYLDRSMADVAAGLAAARVGDRHGCVEALGRAAQTVDATGDRLTQGLVRLAEAHALAHLGEDARDRAEREARRRLTELGTEAPGWRTLFAVALADTPPG